MEGKYKLYTLNDETGIRYVGITIQPLSYRLNSHIVSCKQAFKNKKSRNHRHCWIQALLKKDTRPTIHLIGIYNTLEALKQAEILQISHYKTMGFDLVNTTNGGEGINGYKFTKEQLEKVWHKVDQYSLDGKLVNTFESLTAASIAMTGSFRHTGSISAVIKGKFGRRTRFGYVWRLHGDSFDKHPTTGQWNITDEQKKNLSKRQLENNPMKGKFGILNPKSKVIIITDRNNLITNIVGSISEVINILPFSKSFIYKMLNTSREVTNYKLFYATEEITILLKKNKLLTLNIYIGKIWDYL